MKPKGLGVPTVMERGAKIACYGREGTGKTELVMSARNIGKLYLVDTEGRSQFYDPKQGHGFEAIYSKSPDDALRVLRYVEELHAKGEKVVFGIDSFSSIWFQQQQVAEEKGATSFGTPKFSSWATAKKPLKALYNELFETPVDVIITMRAKPKYEQERSGKVKDFGHDVPETERGMGYTVDLIVEMGKAEKKPGDILTPNDFYAVVVKTSGERDNKLPIGTKITDPSIGKLIALRLSGAPGGMKFDDDVLLQVGMSLSNQTEFVAWVRDSLKLDTGQVVEQLRSKFGDKFNVSELPKYVEWVWGLYNSPKEETLL